MDQKEIKDQKRIRNLLFVLSALFIGVIFLDKWISQSSQNKLTTPRPQEADFVATLKDFQSWVIH